MSTRNRKYIFAYDNISRLKSATYTGDGKFGATYTYDNHGNVKTLTREGLTAAETYGTIDNLTFNYDGTGNQLKYITDAGPNVALSTSADFKDFSKVTTAEYTYNKNGAMTKDLNKGQTVSFNSLNLPQEMLINNATAKGKNYYIYTATGAKLQVIHLVDPTLQVQPVTGTSNDAAYRNKDTTDYVGNKIYENGILNKILTDNGYIEGGIYYFYVRDHLGNNRIVANASGSVIQRNSYYPFGMSFGEETDLEQGKQNFKYNGKELDKTHGLNQYDYAARYMDPATVRFTSVDPLAEKYYNWSPYVYVGNNPMRFTDPTGREWKTTEDKEYANSLSKAMGEIKNAQYKIADKKYSEYKKALSEGDKNKAAKIENEMKGIGGNITNMENGIAELAAMGDTKEQMFSFSKIGGDVGGTDKKDGVILMEISGNGSLPNGVHETSHGYDLWKIGRPTRDAPLDGEIKAYQRQFSFDSNSMPVSEFGKATSLQSITYKWIYGISSSGSYIYMKFANPNINQKEFLKTLKNME